MSIQELLSDSKSILIWFGFVEVWFGQSLFGLVKCCMVWFGQACCDLVYFD